MKKPEKTAASKGGTQTWFDHMTGYLSWKVLGPDITNPFTTPHTLATLNRMAHQRDFLCQFVTVRCTCDGYEVMLISNPDSPRVTSNHPCVSTMDLQDIIEYLRRQKLDEFISQEIDTIEHTIREHVASRRQEMHEEEKRNDSIRIQPKAQPNREKEQSSTGRGGNMRIIKRPA